MTDWGIPGQTLQVNDQFFACLSGIYHLFIDNRGSKSMVNLLILAQMLHV